MLHAALAKLYKSSEHGYTYKERFVEVPKFPIPEGVILTPADREELEIIKAKVQIAFNAYRMHYYKADQRLLVRSVEEVLTTNFFGVTLEGRVDMAANPKGRDGLFIWDFKTAGRFDASMLDAWSFRFQFLYYCWLWWRCTGERPSGVMVNGLAKTLLRPKIVNRKTKQKESKEEYLARVKLDMQANREKFFYRQRMPLAKGMLERFEKEMLVPHINSFKMLGSIPSDTNVQTLQEAIINSLAMSMNTSQCHMYNSFCEFLPLCKDGHVMIGEYRKRAVKHAELEGDGESSGDYSEF